MDVRKCKSIRSPICSPNPKTHGLRAIPPHYHTIRLLEPTSFTSSSAGEPDLKSTAAGSTRRPTCPNKRSAPHRHRTAPVSRWSHHLKSSQATTTLVPDCPSRTSPPPISPQSAPATPQFPAHHPRDLPDRSLDPCGHVVGGSHGGNRRARPALRVHEAGRLAPCGR